MSDVEHMLKDSGNVLKEYIVSLMEGMSLEVSAIQLCVPIPSTLQLTAVTWIGITTNQVNARSRTTLLKPQAPVS